MSIYQEMKDSGVAMDSHESDLYVPVNETTCAILAKYPEQSRSVFLCTIDKKSWFDIPFAFLPFWEKLTTKYAPL